MAGPRPFNRKMEDKMGYTPHTWETGETITAPLLNNIDAALRRASSGIQVHNLATQTIAATTQFLIGLTGARFNAGQGFSLGENEIVCNFDGMVAVSARIYCNSGFTAGDQVILSIGKNSSVVESTCYRMQGTGGETITSKTCLIDVVKGDVLKLKCQNTSGARGVVGNTAGTYANCMTAHYLA